MPECRPPDHELLKRRAADAVQQKRILQSDVSRSGVVGTQERLLDRNLRGA